MANRTRKNSILFYVTDDELALISERMKEVGRNINQIARFVNGLGNVYRHDIDEIKRYLADI